MIGFINIVKYIGTEFDVEDGFDLEQLILLKRQNNMQFMDMGEPPTKFVYFDNDLKEYNVIFLYPNPRQVIDQHLDYIKRTSHTKFPSQYAEEKYGPARDFEVWVRHIEVPDSLVTQMRASLELGYIHFSDEKKFNEIDVSTLDKFNAWANENEVDKVWTTIPDTFTSETKAKDFEYWLNETRGMALNIDQRHISSKMPVGIELYEDKLKEVINTSKSSMLGEDFNNAMIEAGVTIE